MKKLNLNIAMAKEEDFTYGHLCFSFFFLPRNKLSNKTFAHADSSYSHFLCLCNTPSFLLFAMCFLSLPVQRRTKKSTADSMPALSSA
jgi:hypothetical protein